MISGAISGLIFHHIFRMLLIWTLWTMLLLSELSNFLHQHFTWYSNYDSRRQKKNVLYKCIYLEMRMLLQKWFSHIVHYSAQAFRKSPLFYAIMEENWILMFFAHASKVKSNMSFLTACKFSQQVHSIWSWLESLDVGWEWSRNVPLNGENLLWSFSVSNWVENGAHLAEKTPFWWTISVTSMLSEWTDFLSICLSVSP